MNPEWIDRVFANHTHLNLEHADGRAEMAEAVMLALPRDRMVAAVKASLLRHANEVSDDNITPDSVSRAVVELIAAVLGGI